MKMKNSIQNDLNKVVAFDPTTCFYCYFRKKNQCFEVGFWGGLTPAPNDGDGLTIYIEDEYLINAFEDCGIEKDEAINRINDSFFPYWDTDEQALNMAIQVAITANLPFVKWQMQFAKATGHKYLISYAQKSLDRLSRMAAKVKGSSSYSHSEKVMWFTWATTGERITKKEAKKIKQLPEYFGKLEEVSSIQL